MAEAKAVRIAGENRDLPGFLRMPYELRRRIYRECLIEPELWHRPHVSTCRFAAKDDTCTERPAFVKASLVDNKVGDCTCTRRSGLVLLRVCRLIHREASDLFWANNTFCFTHPADFSSDDFFDRVRPSHRLLMRHICVLPYIGDSVKGNLNSHSYRPLPSRPGKGRPYRNRAGHRRRRRSDDCDDMMWMEAMWEAILACQGLQTLELLDTLLAEQLPMYASRMRACLPRLQTFRLVSLLAYKVWPAQEEVDELARQRRTKNKLLLSRRRDVGSSSDSESDNDGINHNVVDDEEDDGLDSSIGLDVPVAVTTQGSTMPNHHAAHVNAPPPPPPPVRRLALNPIIPGSAWQKMHEFSRMLWFKVGMTVDNAVIDSFTRGTTPTSRLFTPPVDERTEKRTEEHYNRDRVLESLVYRDTPDSDSDSDSDSEEEELAAAEAEEEEPLVDPKVAQHEADVEAATSSYRDMLRSFRTNFIVHMRHAIQNDVPYSWGALQEMERVPPLPLRQMDALSPKKIKKDVRYRDAQTVYVHVDHPSFSCQKYGSVRHFLRVGTARPEKQLHYTLEAYDRHDWYRHAHSPTSDPMYDEDGPMPCHRDYGLPRYHPDALRIVQKRIPGFADARTAETAAIFQPTLRDGKQYDVEVFGLPLTRAEHLRRVRERQYLAANKIMTPKPETEAPVETLLAGPRGYRYCNFPVLQKRSPDRRNHKAELRERAKRCSEREREAAEAEKLARKQAGWERRRDAHAQQKQRRLERKRLPGVALLHAEQKRLLGKQRAQQQAEQEELEAEAEKKMRMLQKMSRTKKQRTRRTARKGSDSDDEDYFVAAQSGTSSESDSDDESDNEAKVEEEAFDDESENETEEETEEEEERWPALAKWTKPVKRGPRAKRYDGYAYKKGNRKPARLFYASRNGLNLDDLDALDVYD